ncbi:electron transport complex subunit D [Sulfuriferula plumbiphila]|uniref:Ion-translocating oxidoreductase complex subunit D n=1 Tax=Sulfuriferula plumbiphila TaxID=171865 RepID=A0A512LC32_9PROT|nr:electron transport complex subunit RsxD [Sulfuriferula plumbiphila]BBP04102.1 electron transport complex subunit D [Sulfuriferula plumbiphila]GEP32040.1 electron transport complex subunit D [Sulfuriferula plumbiphila]
MLSSPYIAEKSSVSIIMLKVLAALVPGIAVYVWLFGPAILVTLTLASVTALVLETSAVRLRGWPARPFLMDGSALVTAWLLALSLPPIAPWWLIVVGTFFAIVVAKHLYGGLGNNLFNPAMVGYAVLIISFPVQMTQWPSPLSLAGAHLGLLDSAQYIFTGILPDGLKLDAISSATPLDTLRTQLQLEHTVREITRLPVFGSIGGTGGEVVVLMYLLGGLYLWLARIITWHIPAAFIAGLWITGGLFHVADPDRYISPWFHLATGGAMLGAFFIATDPVSGATTPRGKLIFGAGIGMLTYLIRTLGGYPDGVAFAVLLMNIMVPLIDAYTQPKVYGHKQKEPAE